MWGALASLATTYLGYKKGQDTNEQNKDLMRESHDFQQRNSDTSYQRAAKDLEKAGINPILAGRFGGASTPASALATMRNPMEGANLGTSSLKGIIDAESSKADVALKNADLILKNKNIPTAEVEEKIKRSIIQIGQASLDAYPNKLKAMKDKVIELFEKSSNKEEIQKLMKSKPNLFKFMGVAPSKGK